MHSDQSWVADISYTCTHEDWLCLVQGIKYVVHRSFTDSCSATKA